jgi:cytochrome c1
MRGLQRTALALWLAGLGLAATAQDAKRLDSHEALRTCTGTVTDECIVRHFKDTQEASEIRGRLVFQNYCTLCHGPEGRGDGRAAKLHTPRPFNLTQSSAPRYYVADLIRQGGEALGRGKGMPPWGDQLTNEQLTDVLNFLFTLRAIP